MTDVELVARYEAGEVMEGYCCPMRLTRALKRVGKIRNRNGVWWSEAKRLAADGLTKTEIARRVSRTRQAVAYALSRS